MKKRVGRNIGQIRIWNHLGNMQIDKRSFQLEVLIFSMDSS
jgi:hypothetical protein